MQPKKVYSEEHMKVISFFEESTSTKVKDCILGEDAAYFLVDDISEALKGSGKRVKYVQRNINKRVKVIEYSEDLKKQIKKMFPNSNDIKINKGKVDVEIPRKHKAKAIGKSGNNIKKIRTLLERNHDIKNINIH